VKDFVINASIVACDHWELDFWEQTVGGLAIATTGKTFAVGDVVVLTSAQPHPDQVTGLHRHYKRYIIDDVQAGSPGPFGVVLSTQITDSEEGSLLLYGPANGDFSGTPFGEVWVTGDAIYINSDGTYSNDVDHALSLGVVVGQVLDTSSGLFFPGFGRTFDEGEIANLNRIRWRGPYIGGTQYLWNDMSYEDGWTGVANKDTLDHVAPQNVGDPTWDLPDVPAFVETLFTGVVWAGHEYTLTQPGWINGFSVWIPELTDDTSYRILILDTTDPANPKVVAINEPVLVENTWTLIGVDPAPFGVGTVLTVILDALNSGSSTVITGGWARGDNSNTLGNDPGLNQWGTNNAESTLRISYTDLDSVDRTTELQSIVAGSTIQFVDAADATQVMFWTVGAPGVDEGGTHISFDILDFDGTGIGGEPPVGAVTTMTADVPTPSPTKYEIIADYWLANEPSWATVIGKRRLGGTDDLTADNDAHGVRLNFQIATVSDDWDLLPIGSGSGGGGASSGAESFVQLNDTPTDYAGAAGQPVRVNLAGTGLDFDPTGYLALSGGTVTGPVVITANATANHLTLTETDGTGSRLLLGRSGSDTMSVENRGAGLEVRNDTGGTQLARFIDALTTTSSDVEVLTRIKADNRYLRLNGGTLTGLLTIDDALFLDGDFPRIIWRDTDSLDDSGFRLGVAGDLLIFKSFTPDGVVGDGRINIAKDDTGILNMKWEWQGSVVVTKFDIDGISHVGADHDLSYSNATGKLTVKNALSESGVLGDGFITLTDVSAGRVLEMDAITGGLSYTVAGRVQLEVLDITARSFANWTLNGFSATVTPLTIKMAASATNNPFILRDSNDVIVASLTPDGSATGNNHILRKGAADNLYLGITDGDGRYLLSTGDKMTGGLEIERDQTTGVVGGQSLWLTNDNAPSVGQSWRMLQDHVTGDVQFHVDTGGMNGNVWADRASFPAGGGLTAATHVVTRNSGDLRYLQLAGGTVVGNLEVDGTVLLNSPTTWDMADGEAAHVIVNNVTGNSVLSLINTDTVSAIGWLPRDAVGAAVSSKRLSYHRPGADWFIGDNYTADERIATVGDVNSAVGDYLSLDGGTLSGTLLLTFDDEASLTFRGPVGSWWHMASSQVESRLLMYHSNIEAARFDPPGTVIDGATSILTAEKADARYLSLSGGILTGSLTAPSLIVDNLSTNASWLQINHDGISKASFGIRTYNLDALEIRAPNVTESVSYAMLVADELTGITINVSGGGTNGIIVGRLIDNLLTMSLDKELVTRIKGDNRFLQLSGASPMTGTIVLYNDEPGNLTVDGEFGFDASRGLLINRAQTIGDESEVGTFTVLDGSNVAAVGGITIINTDAAQSGSDPITFGFNGNMGSVLTLMDGASSLVYTRDGNEWIMNVHATDYDLRFVRDGAIAARIDIGGTDIPAADTILTREKADSRYTQIGTPVSVVTFTDITLGRYTGNHGLGTQAKNFQAYLVCVVADGNFAVGERAIMPHSYSVSGTLFNGEVSTGSSNILFNSTGAWRLLTDAITVHELSAANWNLEVHVYG